MDCCVALPVDTSFGSVAHWSVLYCCWLCLPHCDCCGAMSANELGSDGAQVLVPTLAMLVQLQTLNFSCEYTCA